MIGNTDVNGRLGRCTQLLHSTELEEHVLAFDPRVTYLPFTDVPPAVSTPDNLPDILGPLHQLLSATEEDKLFGVSAECWWRAGKSSTAEYATYASLWRHSDSFAYKLGGLLLALAHRIEEVRESQ